MNNFTKESNLDNKYLNIDSYIEFAYKNLNNINTNCPSYEEVFINKDFVAEYKGYEIYIEEMLSQYCKKRLNIISTYEYYELVSTVFMDK